MCSCGAWPDSMTTVLIPHVTVLVAWFFFLLLPKGCSVVTLRAVGSPIHPPPLILITLALSPPKLCAIEVNLQWRSAGLRRHGRYSRLWSPRRTHPTAWSSVLGCGMGDCRRRLPVPQLGTLVILAVLGGCPPPESTFNCICSMQLRDRCGNPTLNFGVGLILNHLSPEVKSS